VDPNFPGHFRLGPRYLYGPAAPVLFTDTETHGERVYAPAPAIRPAGPRWSPTCNLQPAT
jgi:hypothetical protein